MDKSNKAPKTVSAYIKAFPKDIQHILQSIRQTVQAIAPEAEETISYQMPTYKLQGKNLVHFAAFKNHIGFYPTPTGTAKFKKDLSPYKGAKGSVQFLLDNTIPLDIIKKITHYRVQEINGKAKR